MFFNLGNGRIYTSIKGRTNTNYGVVHVADSNIFFEGGFSYSISPTKKQFNAFVSCLIQAARNKNVLQTIEETEHLSFYVDSHDQGYCQVTISCESWFCINMKHKHLGSFAEFLMEYQSRFLG